MPVYSVVIPVYNVEAYLPACLESVLAQDSSSSYEVILVDDGSPDGSGIICDDYAARYPHIRVIHQENAGVSSARNVGIEAAAGDYVLFMDSDDLWTPDHLSVVDPFLGKKPDLVVTCAQSFSEDGVLQDLRPQLFPKAEGESGRSYMQRFFAINALPVYGSYYYVFRRELLLEHSLRFPANWSVNEDLDFVMNCLSAAQTIYGVDHIGYLYRQHAASIVHTPTPKKQMMRLEAACKWFRQYPVASFANLFVYSGFSIAQIGDRNATKDLCDYFEKNRDIWDHTTGRKMKVAKTAFHAFGAYNGSAVIMFLIRLRHQLHAPINR